MRAISGAWMRWYAGIIPGCGSRGRGRSGAAWIAGEFTDFPRARTYNQVTAAWMESGAVLEFRRGLMRDLLHARGADADQIAQVDQLAGDTLRKLEDTLTRQTVPAGYVKFWQMQERLGLPAPFDVFPVQIVAPSGDQALEFNGFGPNTFAFENWPVYYEKTRGLHNGVDFVVPEGSPLIAVADGVIVDFEFLGDAAERSLALRPYLPEQYRQPDGSRVLSNVIVAYGHLTGDPTSADRPRRQHGPGRADHRYFRLAGLHARRWQRRRSAQQRSPAPGNPPDHRRAAPARQPPAL